MAYPPRPGLSVTTADLQPPADGLDYASIAASLTPEESDYLATIDPSALDDPAHQGNPLFESIVGKLQAPLQVPPLTTWPAPAPEPPPDPRIPRGGALDLVRALRLDNPKTWTGDPAPFVGPSQFGELHGVPFEGPDARSGDLVAEAAQHATSIGPPEGLPGEQAWRHAASIGPAEDMKRLPTLREQNEPDPILFLAKLTGMDDPLSNIDLGPAGHAAAMLPNFVKAVGEHATGIEAVQKVTAAARALKVEQNAQHAAAVGRLVAEGQAAPPLLATAPEALDAIKTLFPRLDAYTKKTAPISAATIYKRVLATPSLAPDVRTTLVQVANGLGERRVMADELHALVQGEAHRPDRVLRKVKPLKEGTETIKGAPIGVTTTRHEKAIRDKYLDMLEVGMGGRDWYIDAGGAVRFYANDDPLRARRLAEDLAITSSGTSVSANTGFGAKGYNQATAGVPIVTGRFPTAMGKTIAEVHAPGEAGVTGLKRTPFADNMARGGGFLETDAPARAVHDIWEGEAFGYVNPDGSPLRRGFTPAEHAWMDTQTDKIIQEANARALGGHTDWNEANTQAAAWIGAKVKAGQMTAEDAAKSYASYFEELAAQGSREVTPGRTTGHMPELLRKGPEAARYRQLLHELVVGESGAYDALGRDQIAAGYGGLVGESFDAPGVFEGQVTPGRQTRVLTGSEEVKNAAGKKEGRVLDAGSRRSLDAAEATWALLMGQDAAAYSRLLPVGSGMPRTAVDLVLPGGTATTAQVEAIVAKAGAAAKDAVIVPTPEGVRLSGLNEATVKSLTKDLQATVKDRGAIQGNYLANDWSTQKVGQGYHEAIRTMGPEKFDAFAPQLAERLRRIDAKFAKATKGKVTLSPIMDELRAAVAKEGFAGLERLATKYAIPVALLAAALAALQVPGSVRGASDDGPG
jgi:hypothetical protein